MKIKFFYFVLAVFLISIQKVQAQAKPANVVQDMAERRERREKQMAQVRLQVNEQKAQLQAEKMQPVQSPLPPQGGSGQNNQSSSSVVSEKANKSPGRSNTTN